MDVSSQNSGYLCCQKLCHAYSFKRSCFFLLFFLLAVVLLGVAALMVIFIMKPHKPVFTFETVNLDSYKLDAYSSSTLLLSSVITLTLSARNPNKVGIWYSPAHLEALYDGLPIGTIRIPGFLQPAHSSNVSANKVSVSMCECYPDFCRGFIARQFKEKHVSDENSRRCWSSLVGISYNSVED